MKRKDIIKNLKKAGFEITEGGNHSIIRKDGKYVSALPRHREINNILVKEIEKQTKTKLT